MSRFLGLALCVAVVVPSLLNAQEENDKKPHPQASLETAVPHAIKLLEEKKYKDMIDSFVPPDELKKMKEVGAYETVIKRFGEGERVKQMLQALKEVKELEPEFNEDKSRATFKSDKADSPLNSRPMRFIKVEKRWYIQ